MAHFINKNLAKNALFIHFNGTYHSDNFEGIYWYEKLQENLTIKTISTVEQDDISKLDKENYTKADYIFVIDIDATKTY